MLKHSGLVLPCGFSSSSWLAWAHSYGGLRATCNQRVGLSKSDFSSLSLCHTVNVLLLPKQVKWPTQIEDLGERDFAFCGRICGIRFQECECRQGNKLAIVTIYHKEVVESLLMEILGGWQEDEPSFFCIFSMSACLEAK